MGAITKEQVRRVYALGAAAGSLESGNKNDALHAMIAVITGKDSVSDLTEKEFEEVQKELLAKIKLGKRTLPPPAARRNGKTTAPGMMNAEQQGKAWRCIYRLKELDVGGSSATAGQRMVGAIKKVLGVEARVEDPFKWITQEQGATLIEQLKRYVRSAEAREKKRGSG